MCLICCSKQLDGDRCKNFCAAGHLDGRLYCSTLPNSSVAVKRRCKPQYCIRQSPTQGRTPLHIAAELSLDRVVELLLENGADVQARCVSRTTPFYRAARGGSLSILRMLHEKGSDINVRAWDGRTPLFEAIGKDHRLVVEYLLAWGSDSYTADENGTTPRMMAQK